MGIEQQPSSGVSPAPELEPARPRRRRGMQQAESVAVAEPLWAFAERWVGRALKVSGGVGTLVAMSYFLRIGKIPLDSLASLAGIAVAIAFVTIPIFFAMVVLWGVPSFVFRLSEELLPAVVLQWFEKAGQLSPSSEDSSSKASVWRTSIWCAALIGAPWLAVFAFTMPGYFGGCESHKTVGWAIAACAAIFGLWFAFGQKLPLKNQSQRLVFAVVYSLSSGYPLMAALPLMKLSSLGGNGGALHVWAVIVTVTAAVVYANVISIAFALIAQKTRPVRWIAGIVQLFVVALVLLVVVTLLGAWVSLQNLVMELASVRVTSARVVLDKSACQFMDPRNIELLAVSASASGAAAPEGCVLKRTTVLFSLGPRWPIQFEPGQGADTSQVLLLKSDSVVRVETPVPKESRAAADATCKQGSNSVSKPPPTSGLAASRTNP